MMLQIRAVIGELIHGMPSRAKEDYRILSLTLEEVVLSVPVLVPKMWLLVCCDWYHYITRTYSTIPTLPTRRGTRKKRKRERKNNFCRSRTNLCGLVYTSYIFFVPARV